MLTQAAAPRPLMLVSSPSIVQLSVPLPARSEDRGEMFNLEDFSRNGSLRAPYSCSAVVDVCASSTCPYRRCTFLGLLPPSDDKEEIFRSSAGAVFKAVYKKAGRTVVLKERFPCRP